MAFESPALLKKGKSMFLKRPVRKFELVLLVIWLAILVCEIYVSVKLGG